MINLLPPELKTQLSYAERNTRLRHYLGIGLVVAGLLGGLLWGSLWYANRQIANYQTTLAGRQTTLDSYKSTLNDVQALESNLKLLEKLIDQKTSYSKLLSDLAALLPKGAFINHLQLTGDDAQPMEMILTVRSFKQAAEVRNALEASDRIKSADIQTITQNQVDHNYSVTIVVGFEPGGAQ